MRDGGGRMTRRDLRREATKASVIEAARRVFLDRGYDGATIKSIADAAGVSPGTVLNAAPSKAALLMEILSEEYQAIGDSADRLASALSGRLTDRLSALLQISMEAQARHPELFAAAIGHAWLVDDAEAGEHLAPMELGWGAVRSAIDAAKSSGEIRADVDVEVVVALLQDAYLGVFRRNRADGLDTAKASQMIGQRLRLIFEGLVAR